MSRKKPRYERTENRDSDKTMRRVRVDLWTSENGMGRAWKLNKDGRLVPEEPRKENEGGHR